MSNDFKFRGEVFDGGGGRTGWGKVITFTGGSNPNNGWGASTANTLEEITSWGVLSSIKNSGKMVLAVPHRIENNFNFKPQSSITRFTIEIWEKDRKLKNIFFMEIDVGPIIPLVHKNVTIPVGPLSFEQPIEMLSINEIFMTVKNPNITVV